MFERPAGGWASGTETAKLIASDASAGDALGISVAIAGTTVVAGAPEPAGPSPENRGAVYVFERPAGGWASGTETASLTASDGAPGDALGDSVAIVGDTIVGGASFDDVSVEQDQGSLYVFVKPAGGWANGTEAAKLTASDGGSFEGFGETVGISGDTVVAGAHHSSPGGSFSRGSVYVFAKPAGGWASGTETKKLTASDGEAEDQFGSGVGLAGSTLVVGAFGDNAGAFETNEGSAYVFVDEVVVFIAGGAFPTAIGPADQSSIHWRADDQGAFTVRVGGTGCTDGNVVASGNCTTPNANVISTVQGSDLAEGPNVVRVCVTDAVGSTGSDQTGLERLVNLAPDPAFESDPAPFYLTNGPGHFAWASGHLPHSPTHALRIVTSSGSLSRWYSRTDAIPATPGTAYHVCAYLKTTSLSGHARLSVNFGTQSRAYIPATVDAPTALAATNGWTRVCLDPTAPANASICGSSSAPPASAACGSTTWQ